MGGGGESRAESLQKWEEKELFKEYAEDYNTSRSPTRNITTSTSGQKGKKNRTRRRSRCRRRRRRDLCFFFFFVCFYRTTLCFSLPALMHAYLMWAHSLQVQSDSNRSRSTRPRVVYMSPATTGTD